MEPEEATLPPPGIFLEVTCLKAYRSYTVRPRLPENLAPLREIAMNLRWSYTPDARELIRRVDPQLWEESGQNPIAMFGMVEPARWQDLAENDRFLEHLDRVREGLDRHLRAETWFEENHPESGGTVAYFSFEYGLSEALPLYAGGLGVLAGDHLKSASDMGVPICGVGLLYQVGYFRQYLNPDGWQQEEYGESDFHQMPVEQVVNEQGAPLSIEIPMGERVVRANIWRVQVGRVPLYLLDTNIPANAPADREITYQLYGGDLEMRIRQEILLGIGGIEALQRCLDRPPDVFHLNEGHAAFLVLERVRTMMVEHGLSFQEAVEATRVGNVFTVHTPVTAGHDSFPRALIERYFGSYCRQLDLSLDEFMRLGADACEDGPDSFSMTVLALRFSAWRNGVSELHGRVSRRIWHHLWPEAPDDEVPITSVTNGIHVGSFISDDMAALFNRYLGSGWRTEPGDASVWDRVADIPEAELWRAHERRRERLIAVARRRLHDQLKNRGASAQDLERAREALDPEALTIGFGRRFATYKRATLILRNPERLKRLLTDRDRPVQLLFAGKAHPDDRPGKELIREVVHFARDPEVRSRIVFLENYDLHLARYIVQGVDVWLNTPRRPLEASGTSGMKVTANGGLNCSILDGWWDEAYSPETGWAIGRGEEYCDEERQDDVEADALYTLLEQEIIPLFFDCGEDGIPHGWVAKMKRAMQIICPQFNSNRMVGEYVERFYLPGMRRSRAMADADFARARLLAAWRNRIDASWPRVRFASIGDNIDEAACSGDEIIVRAELALSGLAPDDLQVQLHSGTIDPAGRIIESKVTNMRHIGSSGGDKQTFECCIRCEGAGQWGYTVRVLPSHEDLVSPIDTGRIRLAS